MRWPCDITKYPITQNFADPRWAKIYQEKLRLYAHNGIDIGVPSGKRLVAPHKGVIREALFDANGYGWYIKIENEDETSILAHNTKLLVKEGDIVEEGQEVCISGNTGWSTGDHTHWGYYRTRTRNRQNGFNGYIDQTDWLDHQCPSLEINDQTIIDLGKYGKLEVQAVRGKMGDLERLDRDYGGAMAQAHDLSRQFNEVDKALEELKEKYALALEKLGQSPAVVAYTEPFEIAEDIYTARTDEPVTPQKAPKTVITRVIEWILYKLR